MQVDAKSQPPRSPARSEFADKPFIDSCDRVGVVDEDRARTLALTPQGDVNVFCRRQSCSASRCWSTPTHSINDVVPGGNVKAPTCPSPGVMQYQKLIPEPSSIDKEADERVAHPHQCIRRMPSLHRRARCVHESIQPVCSRPSWRSAQHSFG